MGKRQPDSVAGALERFLAQTEPRGVDSVRAALARRLAAAADEAPAYAVGRIAVALDALLGELTLSVPQTDSVREAARMLRALK